MKKEERRKERGEKREEGEDGGRKESSLEGVLY